MLNFKQFGQIKIEFGQEKKIEFGQEKVSEKSGNFFLTEGSHPGVTSIQLGA